MKETILNVRMAYFQHKGRTKNYHLILIPIGDGRSLIARRWGKVGLVGRFDVSVDEDLQAESLFRKLSDHRRNRGYEAISDVTYRIGFRGTDPNFDQLIADFGGDRWAKLLSSFTAFDLITEMRTIEAEKQANAQREGQVRKADEFEEKINRLKKDKPAHYGTW